MSEIEKGEYVRTKKGKIFKYGKGRTYLGKNNKIVKHSKKLIDLIEVGDLIQLKGEEQLKYEVLKISYTERKEKHIHIINPFRTEGGKDIFIEDIERILTKEKFEEESYKVGE